MLCCHDTWSHLKLTTFKPWVNQYISFSYGNVVLSYVNVPQTQSSSWFQLTYSGIVPLIYVNETICWYSALLQDSSQSFYGLGWIIWCHSKFYDTPFFSLTDCEWLLWGCWIVWCILTSWYLVSLLPVSIIHVSDIFLVGFWSWEISFIMWGCRGWGWQAAGTWVSVFCEMVGFPAPIGWPGASQSICTQ